MAAAAHPQLLFAIMCANMRLVHLVRPKRLYVICALISLYQLSTDSLIPSRPLLHLCSVLHPLDLHLVMNFVSSSTSFRSNECWVISQKSFRVF